MKKILKSTMLIVIAMIGVIKISAAPIFGIAGQGMPNYNSQQNFWGCDPGWQWCSIKDLPQTMALDLRNLRAEYVALDVDGTDDVYVLCPMDFSKVKFTRMFANKQFVVSYPIILDVKMSEAINSRLKTKLAGRLALAPGTYKFEISGRNIKLRNIKVIIQEEAIRKINALGDIEQLSNWDGTINGIYKLNNLSTYVPISVPIEKILGALATENRKAIILKDGNKKDNIIVMEKLGTKGSITSTYPVTTEAAFYVINQSGKTCQGDCIVGNVADYYNIPLCMSISSATGEFQCTVCASSNTACHVVVATKHFYQMTTSLAANGEFWAIDESGLSNSDNVTTKVLPYFFPVGYKLLKSGIVIENNIKYFLMLVSNNKSDVILINRLTEISKKLQTGSDWMVLNSVQIENKNLGFEAILKQISTSAKASKKHDYVGHVTLMCKGRGCGYDNGK